MPGYNKMIGGKFVKLAALITALAAVALGVISTRRLGKQDDGSYLIPTGQKITPAGVHIEVNDRPLGMSISPDGRFMAVATGSNFAPRRLHLIDITSRAVA